MAVLICLSYHSVGEMYIYNLCWYKRKMRMNKDIKREKSRDGNFYNNENNFGLQYALYKDSFVPKLLQHNKYS